MCKVSLIVFCLTKFCDQNINSIKQFIYSFLGIGIVSDLFMSAIEKITSKTKEIFIASAGEKDSSSIEVPVWNGTVANLTLMALGRYSVKCLASIILA